MLFIGDKEEMQNAKKLIDLKNNGAKVKFNDDCYKKQKINTLAFSD